MPGTDIANAVALLAWYRAAGVDAALGVEPINWRERPDKKPGAGFNYPDAGEATPEPVAAPAKQRSAATVAAASTMRPAIPGTASAPRQPALAKPAQATAAPARRFPKATPDEATLAARVAAGTAGDLAALGRVLATFDGCALKATAKSLCFYRGAPQARLMLIGEAPGRDEDIAGTPFVGRAGQLLDKMLAAIALGDADAHFTNIVYWRPPGNRPPTLQEAEICRPFLERQIELVKPDIMVLLGGAAAKHILGAPEGIPRLRGQWREVAFGGRNVRAMAMLPPDYLLRTPAAKRQAWHDLLLLKAALEA